jgi:SAM-dependent MidA family methyltransferase
MTPLAQRLFDRLVADGPVGFDEFVDVALYDPDGGFFATAARPGRRGDFLTAPEVGPLFGALVARWLDAEWRRLGEPEPFTFVDAGAGTGVLARAVVTATPSCLPSLRTVLVDRAVHVGEADPPGAIRVPDMPTEPFTGVIVANELLDNVPSRLAQWIDGQWWELVVAAQGVGFGLDEMPLDTTSWADVLPADPPVGAVIALHDQARSWVTGALELIGSGSLVVIDYGVERTTDLAARSWTDWMRTYRDHQRGEGVFAAVGLQDITCEVAFDQLPRPSSLTTQAAWLDELGIDSLVDEGRTYWRQHAAAPDLTALRMRSREVEAAALTDPAGMGGFLVAEWEVGS